MFIGGYISITTIFLLNLPFVRLQDCPSILSSQCVGLNTKNYLDNPFPLNVNLEVRCDVQSVPLLGWSLSPNGTESGAKMINTSSAKYSERGSTLRINGVDASDEGLYRCVHGTGNIKNLCILVHARAVFASCPSSYDGCSSPENVSVTAGENIYFNASIIHIPGGNCGFNQAIDSVVLTRCTNNDCTSGSTSLTGNARVSQSPERLFTLSNSTTEDSGVYQVVATGINPQNGGQSTMEKTYWVTVTVKAPTTTTTQKETTTVSPTNGTSSGTAERITTDASELLTTISQSTTATTTIYDVNSTETPLPDDSSAKLIPIVCAILVVTVATLATIIILVLCKLKKCTRRKLNKCSAEASRLSTDHGESAPDERGTEHVSEDGSSTVSLISSATDANRPDVQEENERDSSSVPHSNSEDQENIGVITNPMCASSQEASEISDASSQTSSEDDSTRRHASPVDSSTKEPLTSSEGVQETERLSEGGSSAVLLINGNATDAQSSDEQEENKRASEPKVCVDGRVLPHSTIATFNENQGDLEVFANLASREVSTTSDASSLTSTEKDSPIRPACPTCSGNCANIPQVQPQEFQGVENLPHEDQQIRRDGLKPLDLRPEISDLMNKVAVKTPTKWMVLGIQLGLEAAQLQALDHQYRGKSESIYIDIFNRWTKQLGGKPKTWSTVIEALKTASVGELTLAHDLELSMTPSSCTSTNSLASSRSWQQSNSMA